MRVLIVVTLALLTAASGHTEDKSAPAYPAPDSDIPGPFTCYIATGLRKGKFHCLVTYHELNPVAMVIVRGTELTEPLKYLLVKLDTAVEKNPNTRLASFVVFLTDKIKEFPARDNQDDDERENLEKALEDIQRDANLKHLTLALSIKKMLEKYKLDDKAEVVVLLYNRYRTVAHYSLTREELTEAKAKEILGDVASKLGARR
jgi:hypothetical protein